jgi:para-nitrobenzyl esterase
MSIVIETEGGRVRGVEQDGGRRFHGIPYGAAPTGERRFLPPLAAAGWTGELDATAPQAPPAQRPGWVPGGSSNEDCLRLTVTTSAPAGARRPVLVWLPIGGFTMGGASVAPFVHARLAQQAEIVLVVVDARLGSLGYLHMQACGGREWGAASNAGLLDVVQALRWVQRNIERFGGDPGNVTLGGQSAAAVAVHALCGMPAARGLFQRAIQHSSGHGEFFGKADAGDAVARAFLAELGLSPSDSQRLQQTPLAALFSAHMPALAVSTRSHGPRATFCPVVDGEVIPQLPREAVAQGCMRDIPLLCGTNFHEAVVSPGSAQKIDASALLARVRGLLGRHADAASALIETYRAAQDEQSATALWLSIASDFRNRVPLIRFAELHAAQDGATYMFSLRWRSPRSSLAHHGLELPLLLGCPELTGAGEQAELVSRHVIAAWSSFMRGEPRAPDGTPWPRYDAARRATLLVDVEPKVADAPQELERAAWDAVPHAWHDFTHGKSKD